MWVKRNSSTVSAGKIKINFHTSWVECTDLDLSFFLSFFLDLILLYMLIR